MSEETALTIHAEQTQFSPKQLAVLQHAGVKDAPESDLAVFFHQCKRTGLDPFVRQIYMVGRMQQGESGYEKRYTIQVGIDGLRLIARRAVDDRGETLSISQGFFATPNGQWLEFWPHSQPPVAAKVIVKRGEGTFVGVAMYHEYVALKKNGKPNNMWATKPAVMLAKCAEALALRKAFPMDMSGLYTDAEMMQADNPATSTQQGHHEPDQQACAEPEEPVEAEVMATPSQHDQITQLSQQLGVNMQQVYLAGRYVLKRDIPVKDYTQQDAQQVIAYMETRLAQRQPQPAGEEGEMPW